MSQLEHLGLVLRWTRLQGCDQTVQLSAHRSNNSYPIDCWCWSWKVGNPRVGQPCHTEVHQRFLGESKILQTSHLVTECDSWSVVVWHAASGLGQVGLPRGAARTGSRKTDGHSGTAEQIHVWQCSHSDWKQVGEIRHVELGETEPYFCNTFFIGVEKVRPIPNVYQQTRLPYCKCHSAECWPDYGAVCLKYIL